MKALTRTLIGFALVASSAAFAQQVDVTKFYDVTTDGTSQKVKAGEKGTFVLEIKVKDGAHVSDEAPLKLEVKGQNVKAEKEKLTLADSVAKPSGEGYVSPKFQVPFVAQAQGKGSVDAKLTFFICTEKLCVRQMKNVSVPVEVN